LEERRVEAEHPANSVGDDIRTRIREAVVVVTPVAVERGG
jgi:hypothetical protein